MGVRGRRAAALLLAGICLALACCAAKQPQESREGPAQVLLDGAPWDGIPFPEKAGPRVFITLDGADLIDLPFGEPRTVQILQPGIGENTVAITGSEVTMAHADCENQDCVNMGAVTLENLELRVMGGFIVCLPHRLSVEVREEG